MLRAARSRFFEAKQKVMGVSLPSLPPLWMLTLVRMLSASCHVKSARSNATADSSSNMASRNGLLNSTSKISSTSIISA